MSLCPFAVCILDWSAGDICSIVNTMAGNLRAISCEESQWTLAVTENRRKSQAKQPVSFMVLGILSRIAHFAYIFAPRYLCRLLQLWPTIIKRMRSVAAASKKNGGFDPDMFLATIGDGRKILTVPKKQIDICARG